jgi:hypothetical protein
MNENDNRFSAEQVFNYYNKIYGKYSDTRTDIKTVEAFLEKFGHLYQNDIDETCDLLKDYVLARRGLF